MYVHVLTDTRFHMCCTPGSITLQFNYLNILYGKHISVWLRNRIISAGLESGLSHTEKSCKASYYRQFSTNIK